MSLSKKTIIDIDLAGKKVLLRADYNVPIKDGKVKGDFRLKQSLPTIQALLDKKCAIIICSHLGRPKSAGERDTSLEPVALYLSQLLDMEVRFARDCIGDETKAMAASLAPGQILMLENLRYHPEEEANEDSFATQLASLAEVLVQDAFGAVHRKHASLDAITKHLPSVAGLLLEKEVNIITGVMQNPRRPLMAIIGGAKIADKLDVLNKFLDIADIVAVGGAMANTFLLARGIKVGKSLAEQEDVALAKEVLERARQKADSQKFVFYLPSDGIVADSMESATKTRIVDWGANVTADVLNYPKVPPPEASQVGPNEGIYDIGPMSAAFIAGATQMVETVVWNGTVGAAEVPALSGPIGPFAQSTNYIAQAIAGKMGHRPFSVVGGGDTASYIENNKQTEYFDHVSTGGGASLDLMCGKSLPGVDALMDK